MMKVLRLLCAALLLAPLPALAASTSVYLTPPDDPQAVTVAGCRRRARGRQRGDPGGDRRGRGGRARRDRVPAGGPLPDQPDDLPALGGAPVRRRRHPAGDRAGRRHPGLPAGVAAMVSFAGEDQYRVGRVPVPPPTSVPANTEVFDATSSTFYSALSNVDFEIGRGNAGGRRGARPRGAAWLSAPYRLPPRIGPRGHLPGRQRRRGLALLRRSLRHPDREDLARLAIHADRFGVRGTARRRDPRA